MIQLFALFIVLSICTPRPLLSIQLEKVHKTQLCKKVTFLGTNNLTASTHSYKDLIQRSNMFVDKSLFIRDLITSAPQVTVFSTPPGWGKTIILDMLKTFFEFRLNDEYQIDHNTTNYDTYAFFTKGEITWTTPRQTLRRPLLISDYNATIVKYFGRYPVIYLSFKNVTGQTWDEIWTGIKVAVAEAFRRHAHLTRYFNRSICNVTEGQDTRQKIQINLRQFHTYLNGSETCRIKMRKSIRFLSEILDLYYHRKVVLLVDDSDIPMLNIFHYPVMIQKDITKLSSFITDFYEKTLYRNAHIKKSILTSTLCFDHFSQFPPNVKQYTFITTPFPHVFGFTKFEVQEMFDHLQIPQETLSQARDWYNGYKVDLKLSTNIYTPSSIVRYLESRNFGNYYKHSGEFDILGHLMTLKPLQFTFERLLNYHEIPIPLIKLHVNEASLTKLRTLIHQDYGDDNVTADLWQAAMGYLFATGGLAAVSGELFDNPRFIVLHTKLANRQIREEIMDKLFSRYHSEYGVSVDTVKLVVDHMAEFAMNEDSNSSELTRSLRQIYQSYNDLNATESDPKTTRKTTQFLFSMTNYVALMMQRVHNFLGEVFNETFKPNIIMCKESRCVVMDIVFNTDCACDLLEQVQQYEDLEEILGHYKNVETVKFIAVGVDARKNVQICGQVRSFDHR